MVVGFNGQDQYIATAMEEFGRYPIVHVSLRRKIEHSAKYHLEFVELSRGGESETVELFKQELMKFIAENTNLDLPYLIKGKYYKFSKSEIIPGRKYSLLPEIQ